MIPNIFYRIKDIFHNIGVSWDKLALNENNANQMAQKHINPEPEERMADNPNKYSMEYCLAHSGESINDRYRQNRPDEIDVAIADMVAEHMTDIDLILYRGVCYYVYKLMKKNAKVSKEYDYYEKGFMATSLVKGHEISSEIKLRIYVPAGSHVVYMGNVNNEPNFYEVDIQRGAKLKIISIDKEYINCRLLETS